MSLKMKSKVILILTQVNKNIVLEYERKVKIKVVRNKNPLKFFIEMMKNFKTMDELIYTNSVIHHQKVLIAMFNMIGTLVVN